MVKKRPPTKVRPHATRAIVGATTASGKAQDGTRSGNDQAYVLNERDSLEIEVGPFQQHTPFRSFSLDLVHPLSPIKPTRRLKALLQRRLWTLEGTLVSMRQTVALTSQLRDTCLHTRKELFDLTDDPRLPRYFAKGQRTMLAHRVLISGVDPTFSTTSHSRHHSQSISRGRAEEDEEDCEVASPEKSIIHKVP